MGSLLVLLVALSGGAGAGIEINGVSVSRGQSESSARAALPNLYCVEVQDSDPPMTRCMISDGQTPDPDGSITFQQGRVHQASRNWYLPRNAAPYDVLLALNRILHRLTGEDSVCARLETAEQDDGTSTVLVFPDRYLSITTQDFRGRRIRISESLRVNPAPPGHPARGQPNAGEPDCARVESD